MKGSDTVVQMASSEFRVDLETDDVLRSRGDGTKNCLLPLPLGLLASVE